MGSLFGSPSAKNRSPNSQQGTTSLLNSAIPNPASQHSANPSNTFDTPSRTNGRSSIGTPLTGRKSLGNLRAATYAPPRSHTPENPNKYNSKSLVNPVTPRRPPLPTAVPPTTTPRSVSNHPAPPTSHQPRTPRSSVGPPSRPPGAPPPPVPPINHALSVDDLGAIMQIRDGPEAGYRGILRFFGNIQGKGTKDFAGLELLDSWHGLGKNDGTVAGTQYFATTPNNGMFLVPTRLIRVSSNQRGDAVARPQSAMSGRSSRSATEREEDVAPKRASATALPPPTSQQQPFARPESRTPSSRISSRPSVATPARPRMSSPTRNPAQTSPLKDALTGSKQNGPSNTPRVPRTSGLPTTGTPGPLTRPRKSTATLSSATPRTASSYAGAPVPQMQPPPSPEIRRQQRAASREGQLPGRPSSAMSSASPAAVIQTPSRPSTSMSRRTSASTDHSYDDVSTDSRSRRDANTRSLELLDQMNLNGRYTDATADDTDVTPRKAAVAQSGLSRGNSFVSHSATQSPALGEAMVPESAYNEMRADLERRDEQIASLKRQVQANSTLREREQHRLRDETAAHVRMLDEERALEREDEKRRRGEIESREKVLRAELDGIKGDLEKKREEAAKLISARSELSTRVDENEKLIAQLKESLSTATAKHDSSAANAEAISVKDAEISQLKDRVQRLESERSGFEAEIEELKEAGQETITLYELKSEEAAEEARSALEEYEARVRELEAKEQERDAKDEKERQEREKKAAADAANTVSASERESMQEEITHLQNKVTTIEDTLAETQSALETERESSTRRKERLLDTDTKHKVEVKKLKVEIQRLSSQVRDSKEKVEELHEALEERSAALESERAELEVLRAEVEQIAHASSNNRSTDSDATTTAASAASAKIARLTSEVEQLNSLLEGARSGKREATRKCEDLRRRIIELDGGGLMSPHLPPSGRRSLDRNAPRTPTFGPTHFSLADGGDPSLKRLSNTSSSRTSSTGGSGVDDAAREIMGLKAIVNTLSEENADLRAQVRLVKAERDRNGNGAAAAAGEGAVNERIEKLEAELTRSRKEIADLEALVEANVWAKDDLAGRSGRGGKQHTASKTSTNGASPGVPSPSKSPKDRQLNRKPSITTTQPPEDNDQTRQVANAPLNDDDDDDACDDCGSKEHTLENCPLLNEVSVHNCSPWTRSSTEVLTVFDSLSFCPLLQVF